MVGLAFGNSPAAMPAAGTGARAVRHQSDRGGVSARQRAPLDDRPFAFGGRARQGDDRGKQGKPIPLGWALDRAGKPTTDAKAALDGMMLPAGGVKGAMLALIVELLCTSLTGARFGYEADSFFVDAGNQPQLGQVFLAIDPAALSGANVYHSRVEALIEAMCSDPDVRLPGERRTKLAQRATVDGVEIPEALLAALTKLDESESRPE